MLHLCSTHRCAEPDYEWPPSSQQTTTITWCYEASAVPVPPEIGEDTAESHRVDDDIELFLTGALPCTGDRGSARRTCAR